MLKSGKKHVTLESNFVKIANQEKNLQNSTSIKFNLTISTKIG